MLDQNVSLIDFDSQDSRKEILQESYLILAKSCEILPLPYVYQLMLVHTIVYSIGERIIKHIFCWRLIPFVCI